MNAAGLALQYPRRRTVEVHDVDGALQHLLLHESIWSRALGGEQRSRWSILVGYLQFVYEKSHYIFPIVLLFAYSLLGGLIFWSIESTHEQSVLADKSTFIASLKEELLRHLLSIDRRLRHQNVVFANNSYERALHHRGYRRFALNMLYKTVYWYTVSVFYLTEHESHKATALRPLQPDAAWSSGSLGRVRMLRNYTDQLALRCWELGMEGSFSRWNEEEYRKRLNDSVSDYDISVGLNYALTPVWTFWNAMFLAVTTYTTIGYGNITAKTNLGKLAAMVYAVIGIPLVLMILHKLGRFFLLALEHVWDTVIRAAEYLCFVSGGSRLKLSTEDRISEMPLLLAIGVAFGWMFLCAAIFLRFEKDWDYFKSFYFFFCSLTTIGYGDVTPTNSEDMFIIFGLIMIGLSLVSMCINVIQLKLEKLFEELVLMMMEEYSSDPEANQTLKGGHIGMMEMWRVWKKRRGRLRGLAPARDAAGKAGQNIAKVIPFARRRQRHQMIQELHQRLRRKDRGTQTDFPIFLPIYEEAWTETSDIDSYTSEVGNNLLMPDTGVCGPSRCHSQPVVAQAENSRCSSSSTRVTISEPSQQSSHAHSAPSDCTKLSSRSTFSSRTTTPSARSAPTTSPSRFPIDYDPNRRWTFVGTQRAVRGNPRGLVVPHMYMRNQHVAVRGGTVPRTEMERLLVELDARLQDCRYLNTPASSMLGSSSSDASVFH